jgi:hypothetical protein
VGRAWRNAQQSGTQVAIKGAPEAVALACGLGASELQPLLAEASARALEVMIQSLEKGVA